MTHIKIISRLAAWTWMWILQFVLVLVESWKKTLCLMTWKVQVVKLLCYMPNFSKMCWVPFPDLSQSQTFAEVTLWCDSDRYCVKAWENQRRAQNSGTLLNLTVQVVYTSGRNNRMVCRGQGRILAHIKVIFRHIKTWLSDTKISGRLVLCAPLHSEIKRGFGAASKKSTLPPSPKS